MAGNKIKIQYAGHDALATPVEVNQSSEKWNEYLLEDGTVLRMKLILKKIMRVENEFDSEGNPVYVMQTTNVTAVTSPPKPSQS